MFLLSAMKKWALHPREYFSEEKNSATPLKAGLTLLMDFLLFIPLIFLAGILSGSSIVAHVFFGLFLIMFATIPGAFAVIRVFGGKGSATEHMYLLAISTRNILAAGYAITFAITLILIATLMALERYPGGLTLWGYSLAFMAIAGFWTYAATRAMETAHATSGIKSLAALAIPAILLASVFFMLIPLPSEGLRMNINSATDVMKTELKSIVSSGYGTSLPKTIEFKKDAYIDRQSVIGDSPITADEINFYCSGDSNALCGGVDAVLDIQNNAEIKVNQNTRAYVVVCGNDARTQNPKYCVGIGKQPSEARQVCTDKCLS